MGLDGGTKITRSDVLRGQSWRMTQQDTSRSSRGGSVNQVFQEQQLDEQSRRAVLWSTCALSGLPLAAPLVADALGQLFNRQAVLEHLLAAKSVFADDCARIRYGNQQRAAAGAFDHIKSLKDVFAVMLTQNPNHQQQQQQHVVTSSCGDVAGSSSRSSSSLWVCPVTLLPCDSKQQFHALKTCGHVLSGKALTALTAAPDSSNSRCPVCDAPFDSSKDAVLINGSRQHMESVRGALQQRAAAKAAAKASKAAGDGKGKKRQRAQMLEQQSTPALLAEGDAAGHATAALGQQNELRRPVKQHTLPRLEEPRSHKNALAGKSAGHHSDKNERIPTCH